MRWDFEAVFASVRVENLICIYAHYSTVSMEFSEIGAYFPRLLTFSEGID
jgi:hypothetical protein